MPLHDTSLAYALQLRFRGDASRSYRVTEFQAQRLQQILEDGPGNMFVLETAEHQVAIAPSALLAVNILWEPAALIADHGLDPTFDHPVLAYVLQSPEPTKIEVDPDMPSGQIGSEDHQPGQLAELLEVLEVGGPERFHTILDADGEKVMLSIHDLMLLEVPRIYLEPARYAAFVDANDQA